MRSFNKALVYINPFFIYYSFAYALGKSYQWMFKAESVWQKLWDNIIDVFGEDKEVFSVWILNSYAYTLYWTFGSLLLMFELSHTPKALEEFKIQDKKASERLKNVKKVRKFDY